LADPAVAAMIAKADAAASAGTDLVMERYAVTQERVREELAKLAFASIGDFITVQPDGSAVTNLSAATAEQVAALAEITVDEYQDGRGDGARPVKRVRVKLGDKRAALVDLGRHLGMFREKVDLTTRVVLISLASRLKGLRERGRCWLS